MCYEVNIFKPKAEPKLHLRGKAFYMNTENLVPNGSGRVGSQGFRLVIVSIRKEGEVTRSGRVDEGSYLPPPPTDPDVRN